MPELAPQSNNTIDVPPSSRNLYSTLEQEVELGAQALKRESADMAVTLLESALKKLASDQPFYGHLVHNLLASYKLLIEKLLKDGDRSLALDFLRARLRLENTGLSLNNRQSPLPKADLSSEIRSKKQA